MNGRQGGALCLALVLAAGTGAAAAGIQPDAVQGDAVPRWLAPGAVTTDVLTRDLTMTPDMDEFYFCMVGAGYSQAVICVVRKAAGRWTEPETAAFSGDPRWLDLEPFVAPDGGRLYFMSTRSAGQDSAADANLWFVERSADGWGPPRPVGPPVNTPLGEYFPAVTADGTLYFTRADAADRVSSIWRARPDQAGGFAEPELLPVEVNGGTNRFNAWVAPDESRVILSVVGADGNHGLADYWQVSRRPDGGWEPPVNLGARINRGLGRGWSPYVTPDGSTFAYMAAPTGEDVWPVSWGTAQGRAAAPGAAGGIVVIALAELGRPGPGTDTLVPTVSRLEFPAVTGPWLGQDLPGTEPQLFAPGFLSTGLQERDVLVLPGGREIWYGLMDRGLFTVMSTRLEAGRWTEPVTVPFHTDPAFACFEPTLSADGRRVLFLSNRAAPGQEQGRGWANQNIFESRRSGDRWSEPVALPPPVTSDAAEYFPSLARDGTLYFTREDSTGAAIWTAEPVGDGFAAPRRLPAAVNATDQVYNGTVDKEERWIIVCIAGHRDNLGPADYWISFRGPDGAWLPARNMGERFNGPGSRASSASLAPDGTVLFFSSGRTVGDAFPGGGVTPARLRACRSSPGTGSSDLWWIDAKVLTKYQH